MELKINYLPLKMTDMLHSVWYKVMISRERFVLVVNVLQRWRLHVQPDKADPTTLG